MTEYNGDVDELVKWLRWMGDTAGDKHFNQSADCIEAQRIECDRFAIVIADQLVALVKISQLQRDKCEIASAETLYMILDCKVCIAIAAIENTNAAQKDEETP